MKNRIKLIIFVVFCLFFASVTNNSFVFGQTKSTAALNKEVVKLNQEIKDKRNYTKKLEDKQKEYSDAIEQTQSEKADLDNQLALLDNRAAKTELDIERVESDIDITKLEIQKTNVEINDKNKQIEKEKSNISGVLKLMHEKDRVSSLEVLLLNNSLAEFLSQAKYLEDVNKNLEESLNFLEDLKDDLEKEKEKLDEQNEELLVKKDDLEEKKKKLIIEKEDKEYLLEQVNQSEKQYQRLLAQAKEEQQAAANEITNMEKIIRAKLAAMDGERIDISDEGMIWPVTKNVVTTYFHDPEYPFRYIFEHPAIDVRAAQGSTLSAAASGYVARAKDAGKGYSYIMIVHSDGLSTVYGHVSKIYIKEDEYVVQGQKIGLTGGLPGTNGAGNLTTGPHLHFEVRLNGIPVDPLSYLP